ncbi:hypothetical protein CLMAG_48560 [Clostridium magnum DSM 2767]|uniref:Uncharacterized protein n=1 Tax=Clostridium magnum DSM 2767 TaxID=1121326 RepID=A0A161X6Y2_9CLOT|nr:hypothetical protein CLMAG_48560 [Clostridium magnum DSM 2767]SHI70599.1 hypothetical protein SAMN02745944_04720 [Clostridium magnum DSM 2767]
MFLNLIKCIIYLPMIYFYGVYKVYTSKVRYPIYRFLQVILTIDLLFPFISCFIRSYPTPENLLDVLELCKD